MNARGGVTSSRIAPATLPAVTTAMSAASERSHGGMRSRSASAAARLPGVSATVFDAFAITGGSPAASRAGNVISDAPPTTAVTTPPARPAPISATVASASTSRARPGVLDPHRATPQILRFGRPAQRGPARPRGLSLVNENVTPTAT